MKTYLWMPVRTAIGALVLLAPFAQCEDPSRQEDTPPVATELQPLTGGGGLCVILGATRSDIIPPLLNLARGDRLLVHGMATDIDPSSLTRAQQEIAALNLAGRATIERLASGGALPHMRNLADVVVVTDLAALAKAGVTMEEVRRVVVPGGVVFTRQDGQWKREIKGRPPTLDRWTHVRYGPGDELASVDGEVDFPGELRWVDGIPLNFDTYIACRGMVADDRRLFLLTSAEPENYQVEPPLPLYAVARNAFNGLVLWKTRLGYANPNFLTAMDLMAFATDGKRLYCNLGKELVALDNSTGKVAMKYANRFPAIRLFVTDGLLVVSQWESRPQTEKELLHPRNHWWNSGTQAVVQAFDTGTGKLVWETNNSARWLLGADGNVYLLVEPLGLNIVTVGEGKTHAPTSQEIVALDLRTGRERWRVPHTAIAPMPTLRFCLAGAGSLVLEKSRTSATGDRAPTVVALAAEDGKVQWEKPGSSAYLANGRIVTGVQMDRNACTSASVVADRWSFHPRAGGANNLAPNHKPGHWANLAARGACGLGYIPANGQYYVPQNMCGCTPAQIRGLLSFGPTEKEPTKADFEAERPVERGPAFGFVKSAPVEPLDWPEFLGNAERDSRSKATLKEGLRVLWKTAITPSTDAVAKVNWDIREANWLTSPVGAFGLAIAAARESGQVVALDLTTGLERWRYIAGAGIRNAPALWGGYCFFGTQDGWVQALRATDGVLAWRVRAAPLDQRMVAFGRIESPWPIPGIAMFDGTLYVTVGRNSENRGIGLCALDPVTGATKWARRLHREDIAPNARTLKGLGYGFHGDCPMIRQGKVCVNWMALETENGRFVADVSNNATSPTGWHPGIHGTLNITERLFRTAGDHNCGGSFFGVQAHFFTWDDRQLYVLGANQVRAFNLQTLAATTNGPPKMSPAIATFGAVHAFAQCANRLVLTHSIERAKDQPQQHLLELLAKGSGKSIERIPLPATPVKTGLAMVRDRVLVTLEDGHIVCIGN